MRKLSSEETPNQLAALARRARFKSAVSSFAARTSLACLLRWAMALASACRQWRQKGQASTVPSDITPYHDSKPHLAMLLLFDVPIKVSSPRLATLNKKDTTSGWGCETMMVFWCRKVWLQLNTRVHVTGYVHHLVE